MKSILSYLFVTFKSIIFRRIYTPLLACYIRHKKIIRVLFVLQYLSEWKTEALYIAMLNHSRFEPIIGIIPCMEIPEEEALLKKYCEQKGYPYQNIQSEKTLTEQMNPDIVIHPKQYDSTIYPKHQINANPKSLFVYVPYAFNNIVASWYINTYLTCYGWQFYFENNNSCEELKAIHKNHGYNFVATGLPMMDILLLPKHSFANPWPEMPDSRKRIIYAPHHTIANLHAADVNYSTFLENCDFMLEMAEKYKSQVYFVFKPHPRLHRNLVEYWGKEKADAYYKKWEKPGVSHIELGEYIGLFKHSDAMIHDCGSFIIEYMYTDNPVMYLVKDSRTTDNMTQYAKSAYDLHYKGKSHEDIERFIQDVIAGNDPIKEIRLQFVEEELTPPNGKTACQNIINAILGMKD